MDVITQLSIRLVGLMCLIIVVVVETSDRKVFPLQFVQELMLLVVVRLSGHPQANAILIVVSVVNANGLLLLKSGKLKVVMAAVEKFAIMLIGVKFQNIARNAINGSIRSVLLPIVIIR
jgi:hypothetical protein